MQDMIRSGRRKIEWVQSYMPILGALREEFKRTQPLRGHTIALSIHMEAKTAALCLMLSEAGARMAATGCNPLSTQDDVAMALESMGIEVHARHGVDEAAYNQHLNAVLDVGPDIVIDDGGDLVNLLHTTRSDLVGNILGGCEETTTGVTRLKSLAKAGLLKFPMIAVNDAQCKHLFDNRYGTGQSAVEGIMRATNHVLAGKVFVVAGYGWCGRGVAERARVMGARVMVTEVNPVRALQALMDGFEVGTMQQAAQRGDIFVTTTGCKDIIRREHMEKMKDGVLLCNAGHFDLEINKAELQALSTETMERRNNVTGYRMQDGRILNLLSEGRLVNLACADGHPVEIMDMSFGLQALSACYIARGGAKLRHDVYPVPPELDAYVARLSLKSRGVDIDTLTPEQQAYLEGHKA